MTIMAKERGGSVFATDERFAHSSVELTLSHIVQQILH